MRYWTAILLLSLGIFSLWLGLGIPSGGNSEEKVSAETPAETAMQSFPARGVILAVEPEDRVVVIRHEAIANYMDAMTMPFKVKDASELAGLERGDRVSFQLDVTDEKSWIEKIVKTGRVEISPNATASEPLKAPVPGSNISLLDYKFTNEPGQAVGP